jgi:predicted pyridoxine 5'-phosphate oxidase superfamily flavin-nucleotide-binding protein
MMSSFGGAETSQAPRICEKKDISSRPHLLIADKTVGFVARKVIEARWKISRENAIIVSW